MAEKIPLADIPIDGRFWLYERVWTKWCESDLRKGLWLCLSYEPYRSSRYEYGSLPVTPVEESDG